MWKKIDWWKTRKKNKRDINEVYFDDIELKDYFIIDVRSRKEYKEGHLDGAINIPVFTIKNNIEKIDKNKKILVYCQSGMRSKKAVKILKSLEIRNVYNLKGGIESI